MTNNLDEQKRECFKNDSTHSVLVLVRCSNLEHRTILYRVV